MIFRIPEQPSNSVPKRQAEMRRKYPQAVAAIDHMLTCENPVRYGSKASEFLNDYHFQSDKDVNTYFRSYLKERLGNMPSDDEIGEYADYAINKHADDIEDNESCSRSFSRVANGMIDEIILANKPQLRSDRRAKTMLRFILGPTGSGKTAFSKGLFNVTLLQFWGKKIVPTRVEFSKISKLTDGSVTQKFFEYVRRCQLRDLLIYLVFAPGMSPQHRIQVVKDAKISMEHETRLIDAITSTSGIVIDGEDVTINDKIQGLILNVYDKMTTKENDDALYSIYEIMGVSFLISFDGFDTVIIDDFFFGSSTTPAAIDNLANLVKRLWSREVGIGLHSRQMRAHYLVYVRDTTFERLRPELIRGVGEEFAMPLQYIVPPRYEQMVRNAAFKITGTYDSNVNHSNAFLESTFDAFDRAIFSEVRDQDAKSHLNFLFSSNARWMKRHIVRSLLWDMHRAAIAEHIDFRRHRAGIDVKWLWSELVRLRKIRVMPRYMVLEELYLDETRQLVPTLIVETARLGACLKENDFKGALSQTQDRDETASTYGCALNYVLEGLLFQGSERSEYPQLLLFIRAMQFIRENHRKTFKVTHEFLRNIGYEISENEMRFLIYLLMRNHLILWDGSTGNRSVDQVPMYLSTKGSVLLEKLLFTVTYTSESMLNSLICDDRIDKVLKRRTFKNPRKWNADCVHNATVFSYLVDEIELIEQENAENVGIEFGPYLIGEKFKTALHNEAAAIYGNKDRVIVSQFEENAELLKSVAAEGIKIEPIGIAR